MLWITNINRRPSEVGWQGPYEDAQGAMTLGRFDIQFPTNNMDLSTMAVGMTPIK
jgi:hypothetical protein